MGFRHSSTACLKEGIFKKSAIKLLHIYRTQQQQLSQLFEGICQEYAVLFT